MVMKVDPAQKWSGPTRKYDIIKEGVIALVIIGVLAAGLSLLFSSPDDPAVTLKSWSNTNAPDFAATAAGELAGTTTSAGYGAPYNTNGSGQHLGPIKLQDWVGIHIPVTPAEDFVLKPLQESNDSVGISAVNEFRKASADQQSKWATAYQDGLTKAGASSLPADPAKFGPVPQIISALTEMAKIGEIQDIRKPYQLPLLTCFRVLAPY